MTRDFARSVRATVFAAALMVVPGRTEAAAAFDYDRSPDAAVVRYELRLGEVGEEDRGPGLAVYGDGRAEVHYPRYMVRAGDYTLQLDDAELADLVNALVASGLADFDGEAVRAARGDEVGRQAADGELEFVSDSSRSQIELSLQEPRVGAVPTQVRSTVTWSALESDARRFPGVPGIQGLASAERSLRALMERAQEDGVVAVGQE